MLVYLYFYFVFNYVKRLNYFFAAMSNLVTRSFRVHGYLTVDNPWEVIFLVTTATLVLATSGNGLVGDGSTTESPSAVSDDYQNIGAAVMTVLRCAAMLYTYHQLRLLQRQNSAMLLGKLMKRLAPLLPENLFPVKF